MEQAEDRSTLLSLANTCRFQLFQALNSASKEVRKRISTANFLSLRLMKDFLSPSEKQDLISQKNRQIRQIWTLFQRKSINLVMKYVEMMKEMQGLTEELRKVPLLKEFMRITPTLFHKNLLASLKFDAPGLKLNLSTEKIPTLSVLFAKYSKFHDLFLRVTRLKHASNQLFLSNEVSDLHDLVQTCQDLSSEPVDDFYVTIKKWDICLPAAEVVKAQIVLVKTVLTQIIETGVREGNNGVPEEGFSEELQTSCDVCFTMSTVLSENNQRQQSGFWLHLTRKITQALHTYSPTMELNYALALRSAKRHSKAAEVLQQSLDRGRAEEDYDPGTCAQVMFVMGWVKADLKEFEEELEWFDRVNELGLLRDADAVDFYLNDLDKARALTWLCRFQEAENVLKAMPIFTIQACDIFGKLYLAWDRFAACESWLKNGIAAVPQALINNLHLNLVRLYNKQNKWEASREILRMFLRHPDLPPVLRAKTKSLLGRVYTAEQDFPQARKFLDQAALLQDKYKEISLSARAYTAYHQGLLSVEIGLYGDAERHFQYALGVFKSERRVEMTVLTACQLAEVYVHTDRLPQAENILTTVQTHSQLTSDLTANAAFYHIKGRISLAKGDFYEARVSLNLALNIQLRLIPGTRETGRTYVALGRVEVAEGNYSKAYKHCTEALLRLQDCVGGIEAYLCQAEIYEKTGNSESVKLTLQRGMAILEKVPTHALRVQLQEWQNRVS